MGNRYLLLLLPPVAVLTLFGVEHAIPRPEAPVALAPEASGDVVVSDDGDGGDGSGDVNGGAQKAEQATSRPVFVDWIALGSGCRARFDMDGDITAERFTAPEDGRFVNGIRFHMDRFRLTSAGLPPEAPRNFARECNVRIQLFPPPGKRVASVSAATRALSSKSEGTKLTLQGVMNLGAAIIGRKVTVYQAGAELVDQEDAFNLVSGAKPEEALPALACGEGAILGFSYTWLAERRARSDEVAVELAGDRVLELRAELVDCS